MRQDSTFSCIAKYNVDILIGARFYSPLFEPVLESCLKTFANFEMLLLDLNVILVAVLSAKVVIVAFCIVGISVTNRRYKLASQHYPVNLLRIQGISLFKLEFM